MGSVLLMILLAMVGGAMSLTYVHHNNAAMAAYLREVHNNYPDITKLYSIGKTVKGEDMWVLAIGSSFSNLDLRPHVKYIGNMHGNEVVSRELLLHLIDLYVTSYGTNVTLTQFLDTTTVHIMPSMNPDGYSVAVEEQCGEVLGRPNANSKDLNRNFPDLIHDLAVKPVQPETQHVIDWLDDYNFVLSANLHGGVMVANYPWDLYMNTRLQTIGSGKSICPDDDTFKYLALTYSRSHHTMSKTNGTECGYNFPDGITNGADWYPVSGGMQDYNYIAAGIFEITLEVSCCKFPAAPTLVDFWIKNKDALVNYLLLVHMGVKGYIRDKNNNSLDGAVLSIKGREFPRFRSKHGGQYFRLLMPGEYTLNVSYKNHTESKQFTVSAGVVTRLDVTLDVDERDPSNNALKSTSSVPTMATFYMLLHALVNSER
ncbi:carboxypeptidase M-like isoform X3 [Dreissena polymorpha]|nr:carboxypeptidase M-like isoform X3 [Dreissena polymorpha]XP_052273936.1 carboxypeptidase M-like isoform X3 [Dreissena polymorpha]XP_052273937.1 carboxypeptidase M-like isoform X3 [Dreissena polymorpha]XP_052273938.1 carboxypeptidase M-like isoform X3 [Dreissena polymorpha]XP_052273939.1 carboxypeptidase M-like isoform X3 [Dreissena polymorpha]